MFKVSSILTDTAMQSLSPLVDCSVKRWSKWCHSLSSRSFKWSTSRIRQLYTLSCKMPQIAAGD